MKIGIPAELLASENRVAATPKTVARLKKQGFEVYVEKAGSYLTNLKYSQNFQLSVNGNSRELEKEGIFSKIYLESGKNNVKLRYFPTDIILGLGVGFTGLLFIFLIFNKQKFYSFFKRNNI